MSTGAGGTNLGGGANFNMLPGAMVELSGGASVSVTTEAGVSAAREALDSADFLKLDGLMEAQGYKLEAGVFVAKDAYGQKAQGLDMGPTESVHMSAAHKELDEKVFEGKAYNAATTEANAQKVLSSASGQAAVAAGNAFVEDPTAANQDVWLQKLNGCADDHSEMNIYELLFICFRESIHQTNQDKAYFLNKIQEFNNMAEGISEYLGTLVEKSQELETEKAKYDDTDDKEKQSVSVEVKTFDLSGVDSKGQLMEISGATKTEKFNADQINKEIKNVESMQETVRNKRQMASTSFQNFDQKSNQLYNLMSSVLKSVMRCEAAPSEICSDLTSGCFAGPGPVVKLMVCHNLGGVPWLMISKRSTSAF